MCNFVCVAHQSTVGPVYSPGRGGYRRVVDLRRIAVVVWVLSWVGLFVSYIVSAQQDHIPSCIPHLAGCTSVSSSGRHGAGFFIFKATMLPAAAFLMVYWVLCGHWLRCCGETSARWRWTIVLVGLVGAAFLVFYTTFLGSVGDIYRTLRRYGTVMFFGMTYLAQLLLAYRAQAALGDTPLVRTKVWLCLGVLIEGLVLVVLTNLIEDDDWLENLTEWHVSTAISFYPFLTWLMWRNTGLTVEFSLKSPPKRGGRSG